MAQRTQQRDLAMEQMEHDSFLLLQHLYTLGDADPDERISAQRACTDLGFTSDEAYLLIQHLIGIGFARERAAGPVLSITPQGVDYIERLAWRRQSIRRVPPGRSPGGGYPTP